MLQRSSSAFVASPQLLEQLEKRSIPVVVGPSRVLFREGDKPVGVYIVRKGWTLLTSGTNGETVLSVEAGRGSLLGVPGVMGGKTYSLTAEVIGDAEVGLISGKDFLHLMQTEPLLSFEVLKVLAEEVRFARETLVHF